MLLISAFAFFSAEAQSPLDVRISLTVKDLPIIEVLYKMIDLDVPISCSNNILPTDKRLNFSVSNFPVGKVLPLVLAGTDLGYEVVGSQIVVVKKPPPIEIKRYTLNGFITDVQTGERIISATLYDEKRQVGTYTNEFGYFSINVLEGPLHLVVSSLGYESTILDVDLKSSKSIEIKLKPFLLTEVVVSHFNDSSYLQTDFGKIDLNLKLVETSPSLAGETDLMRLAYTLPGIQTGADGFGGISVRGGDVDQNLFLLDGVPVYNALHGLGIYSIYNTDAVRSAKILKGDFPAQYGGRVSSIWDIQMKEGNMNKVQGQVEIGPSSVQTTVEGPIKTGQGSWFISGRRALFDFFSVPITKQIRETSTSTGYLKYFFYDFNAKTNYKITNKDRVYLSFYHGKDDFLDKYEKHRWFSDTFFVLSNKASVQWGNTVSALRWNHLISNNIFANITATYSRYFYNSRELIDLELLTNDSSLHRDLIFTRYKSNVEDIGLKMDFDYASFKNNRFRFGTSFTKHKFQPGVIYVEELTQDFDNVGAAYLKEPLYSAEFDAYVQDEFEIGRNVSANIGVRGSLLLVNGDEFFYPQPRMIFHFWQDKRLSFNLSATKTTQMLHLLSPSTIGLPKDLWVSATKRVKPQEAWQYSIGTKYEIKDGVSIVLQGYYKKLKNILYFQGAGVDAINATNWQDQVESGKGWGYGAELLLKMERGKFGGWAGYTYAHADRQFGIKVNNGDKYPIRLDRRHKFNLLFLYKISAKWDFSTAFEYATGSAQNLSTQGYEVIQETEGGPPSEVVLINSLNEERLPDYHRLDFSFSRYFKIRNVQHTIRLGVYNTYGKQNPIYKTLRETFDEDGNGKTQIVSTYLPPFFPTLRYIMDFN